MNGEAAAAAAAVAVDEPPDESILLGIGLEELFQLDVDEMPSVLGEFGLRSNDVELFPLNDADLSSLLSDLALLPNDDEASSLPTNNNGGVTDGRIEGHMPPPPPLMSVLPPPPPPRSSDGAQPLTVLSYSGKEIHRSDLEGLLMNDFECSLDDDDEDDDEDDEEEASLPPQNGDEGAPSGAVLAVGEEVPDTFSQGRDAVEVVEERDGGIADGRIEGPTPPTPLRASAGTQPPAPRQQGTNQPLQLLRPRAPPPPAAAAAARQVKSAGGEGVGPGLDEENFSPNDGSRLHASSADRSASVPNKKSRRPYSKSNSSTLGGEMASGHNGREQELAHLPNGLRGKKNSSDATDMSDNLLQCTDTVTVVEGPRMG
jgi:hypothetical protein